MLHHRDMQTFNMLSLNRNHGQSCHRTPPEHIVMFHLLTLLLAFLCAPPNQTKVEQIWLHRNICQDTNGHRRRVHRPWVGHDWVRSALRVSLGYLPAAETLLTAAETLLTAAETLLTAAETLLTRVALD